ncbi:transposase [Streptomyces sp. SP18CS02]|nr:transposase [Streptomyces sp. SP18CS02]MEE1756459.1 transposase [Streptomyces sp. SP18CS02]
MSRVRKRSAILDDLCEALFAELPRVDQRRKGAQYLHGLLKAEGRKSVRNIAASVGGRETAQSLHHFIASSTWDWEPVRQALTRHADRELRVAAWVVQSIVIPKVGTRTVGVERRYVPSLGHAVSGQQAVGVWGVAERATVPVQWSLLLPGDRPAERAADVTVGFDCSPMGPRPVVLDMPDADLRPAAERFVDAGEPLLARVHGDLRVTEAAPWAPGGTRRSLHADRLLQMNRMLRRPVEWTDPVTGTTRRSLIAGVRVEWAGRPLLLLGQWDRADGRPAHCWITNLTATPLGVLLRLAKLVGRVEQDFVDTATQVGILDYEGRSLEGWHRHMTLASAAHLVRILSAAEARVRPWSHCMDTIERMDRGERIDRMGRGDGAGRGDGVTRPGRTGRMDWVDHPA